MVKKEEYYLEVYSGTYEELIEVRNSYVGTTAQSLWESRREKNAVLLIRRKLEEVGLKRVEGSRNVSNIESCFKRNDG